MIHQPHDSSESRPRATAEDPFPEGDALWDTLGRAVPQELDGWFAARTLARARRSVEAKPGWVYLLRRAFATLALGGIAILLALVWIGREAPQPASVSVAEASGQGSQSAPEVVAMENSQPAATPFDEAFEFLAASNSSTTEDVWAVY